MPSVLSRQVFLPRFLCAPVPAASGAHQVSEPVTGVNSGNVPSSPSTLCPLAGRLVQALLTVPEACGGSCPVS